MADIGNNGMMGQAFLTANTRKQYLANIKRFFVQMYLQNKTYPKNIVED